MSDEPAHVPSVEPVCLPVARGRWLTKGVLWLAAAILAGLIPFHVVTGLGPRGSTGGQPLIAFSWLVGVLPLAAASLAAGWAGLRCLVLACWPGAVGVLATPERLTMRFGPFGTTSYDAARLDVRYLFELSADSTDEGFEAFLPEEEQIARLLPRICHANTDQRLNEQILRFTASAEAEIATRLGPLIRVWRNA